MYSWRERGAACARARRNRAYTSSPSCPATYYDSDVVYERARRRGVRGSVEGTRQVTKMYDALVASLSGPDHPRERMCRPAAAHEIRHRSGDQERLLPLERRGRSSCGSRPTACPPPDIARELPPRTTTIKDPPAADSSGARRLRPHSRDDRGNTARHPPVQRPHRTVLLAAARIAHRGPAPRHTAHLEAAARRLGSAHASEPGPMWPGLQQDGRSGRLRTGAVVPGRAAPAPGAWR